MAYFAQIDETNKVVQVISVSNAILGEPENQFPQTEPLGQSYIAEILQLPGTWLQTSYNANFRALYAGIGYSYDQTNDVFVSPPINNA